MIVKGNHKLRECLNLNQIKTERIFEVIPRVEEGA